MANNSAGNKPDKVFDVTKPGKTAAGASGRPLIVGHKTLMQDPMVKEPGDVYTPPTAPELDQEDKPSGKAPKSELTSTIMKPSLTKVEPVEDKRPEPKVEDKPNEDKPNDEPPVQEETQSTKEDTELAKEDAKPTEENAEPSTSSDSAAVNTVAQQVAKKQQNQKEQEEETAKATGLEKLIDDKKYFVPIGEKRRKRSIRHVLLGFIIVLLLGAVLGDLLIDAGVIKTSIEPPIKVFQTK